MRLLEPPFRAENFDGGARSLSGLGREGATFGAKQAAEKRAGADILRRNSGRGDTRVDY